MGRNKTWKKGKGEAISSSDDFKAVGKNIKWGTGEGGLKIWGRKSNAGGEEYQVEGDFIHPCFYFNEARTDVLTCV